MARSQQEPPACNGSTYPHPSQKIILFLGQLGKGVQQKNRLPLRCVQVSARARGMLWAATPFVGCTAGLESPARSIPADPALFLVTLW